MTKFTLEQVRDLVDEKQEVFYNYLRLDSVSTQNRKIKETAEYVKQMFENLGGEAKLLDDLGGYPFVYGSFKAGPNGNPDKTILFYNHYDVQPEDPMPEWNFEPFEPTREGDKLVARGVSDDKGELMARLYAIDLLHQSGEGLPCNVKFFVEGEEEIGSPNINRYLEHYADLLEADVCFWEGGEKNSAEDLVVFAGVKGIAYFDLLVEGANADIHSSKGAVVDNAAWRLVQALATLRTVDNKITVDGFYDLMEEPNDYEKEVASHLDFDPESQKAIYGLQHPMITDDLDYTPQEAMVFYPTLTISGLEAGYTGEGTKTIVPRSAKAKLDFRLVPGYTPEKVEDLLRKHLDKREFEDVKVNLLTKLTPFRTDLKDPFVDVVMDAAKQVYGENVVLEPSSAGGGPMSGFGEYLGVPIVSAGVGYSQSGPHAPNEHIRMSDFYEGVLFITELLKSFS